jgi:hypothetical protein
MAEKRSITGSSFDGFSEAALAAFSDVQGDPDREGIATAKVVALGLEKGGFVGRTQFHVDLEVTAGGDDEH